jgi:hypothetical protein
MAKNGLLQPAIRIVKRRLSLNSACKGIQTWPAQLLLTESDGRIKTRSAPDELVLFRCSLVFCDQSRALICPTRWEMCLEEVERKLTPVSWRLLMNASRVGVESLSDFEFYRHRRVEQYGADAQNFMSCWKNHRALWKKTNGRVFYRSSASFKTVRRSVVNF